MKFSDAFKRALFHGPVRYFGKKIEKKHFQRKPILIVACPRSGTTLLLSILSAIPGIFAVPNQTYAFDRWEGPDQSIPTRLDKLMREFIFNRIPPTATRWPVRRPTRSVRPTGTGRRRAARPHRSRPRTPRSSSTGRNDCGGAAFRYTRRQRTGRGAWLNHRRRRAVPIAASSSKSG